MRRMVMIALVVIVASLVASAQGERRPNITTVKYSHSGQTLAVGYGGDRDDPCGLHYMDLENFGVFAFEVSTQEKAQLFPVCAPSSFAFSPDDTRLASVTYLGQEVIWDFRLDTSIERNDILGRPFIANDWLQEDLYVFSTNTLVGVKGPIDDARGVVRWKEFHSAEFSGFALSPNSAQIVTTSEDGTAVIWTLSDKEISIINSLHGIAIHAVAWHPSNDHIATGDDNGVLAIWDSKHGETIVELNTHAAKITEVVWSPDGTMLASASEDGTVRVWDTETGDLLETFTYTGPVYALDWSPDGTQIAFGGADTSGNPPQVMIVDAPHLPEADATPSTDNQ